MKLYSPWIQHVSNPLHIYCRLRDCGISMKFSKRLSTVYEKVVNLVFSREFTFRWKLRGKKY